MQSALSQAWAVNPAHKTSHEPKRPRFESNVGCAKQLHSGSGAGPQSGLTVALYKPRRLRSDPNTGLHKGLRSYPEQTVELDDEESIKTVVRLSASEMLEHVRST